MSAENTKLGTSFKLHFKCLNGTIRTLELSNSDDCALEQIIKLLFNKKILKPDYGYNGISKIRLILSSKSNPERKIKFVELKQSVLELFSASSQNDIVLYISFGLFDKNIKEQSLTLKSLTEINPKENNEPKELLKSVFMDRKGTEFTLEYFYNDKLKLIELIKLLLDKKMLQQDSGTKSVILLRGGRRIDLFENCQITSCLKHWNTTGIVYGTLSKTMNGKTITLADLKNMVSENNKRDNLIQRNLQNKSLQVIFKDICGIKFTLEVDRNNNYKWSKVAELLVKQKVLCNDKGLNIRFIHKGRPIDHKESVLNIFQNNKGNESLFVHLNVKINKSVNNNMMTLESLLNTNQMNNNQDKQLIRTKTEKQTKTLNGLKNINNNNLKHNKINIGKNAMTLESFSDKNHINNDQKKQPNSKETEKQTITPNDLKNITGENLKRVEINIDENARILKSLSDAGLDANQINNDQDKQVIRTKTEKQTKTPNDLKNITGENLKHNEINIDQSATKTITPNSQRNIVCNNLSGGKIENGNKLRILGFICVVGGVSISAIKLFGICKIGTVFVIIPAPLLIMCGLLLIFNIEIRGKLLKKPEISDNDPKKNNQEQISIKQCNQDVIPVPKESKETDNTVNKIG